MRHFFYTLFAILSFVACSESDVDNGGNNGGGQAPPKQPEITLNATAADFSTDGGSDEITFTSSAAWTAEVINSRADAWCSINPTSGEAGNAKITVTTTANDTPDDRTASIIIKAGSASKTINISQKQKDALTVTASKFEVGAEGGEVTIEVKANIDFEYAIEESAKEWITYQTTRAIKTSTLVFKVAENESEEKRECKIVIKSGEFNETVTIYQAGSTPTIILTKDKFSVPSAANTITVEVKSNVDVAVEMPDNAEWIKESTTRAFSTNTYNFDIEQNESYDNRTAEIKFTNKENDLYEVVTITQMQRDAIVVADTEYEFYMDGGELDFEIQTNVDISVSISDNAKSWIQQVETRKLETKALYFNIAAYSAEEDREGTITISGGDATQVIKIKQDGILSSERKALIAFYNATGGDNWTNNENWCSDKPVGEWYGITTFPSDYNDNGGRVYNIDLRDNNLSGSIPEAISELSSVMFIDLYWNNLSGEIPKAMYSFKDLLRLDLAWNNLSGEILSDIGNLTKLNGLWLQGNKLTGEFPASLSTIMTNIVDYHFYVNDNMFSGKIPIEISSHPRFEDFWMRFLDQQPDNGVTLDISGLDIPAPTASVVDLNGKQIYLPELYRNNKLTILYNWASWCSYSAEATIALVPLYNAYKPKGLEMLGYVNTTDLERPHDTKESVEKAISDFNIPWDNVIMSYDESSSEFTNYVLPLFNLSIPTVLIVNSEGKIIYQPYFPETNELDFVPKILAEYLGDAEVENPEIYESTDYSKDGEIKQLQTATKGEGIDIVLMGDAYSDRLIADGTYDNAMNTAMEKFFTEEPYKSFRDHFNVYSVNVVSKNEVYHDSSTTALESWFGEGTLVGGNDSKAFTYALKAISEERMDNAMVVVIMNDLKHAGTCYMYHPTNGDWGNGVSVSYFPAGASEESLGRLLHHEACGHGFAKLADEYAYQENGQIPDEEIESRKANEQYGWWRNADFTNDPTKVKWAHFLNDSRYANDGLGVYEGAFTYWTGAYRPTDNSIMNTNVGGFNAPSREAIYYRIHKLAYGADWQYDYEKFVEWDAKNRKAAATTRGIPYRLDIPKDYKPTHPPVVISKSWRDAK